MRVIKFILLGIVKLILLIVYVPVFILNLIVTYAGSIIAGLLGIVGALFVIVGFLSLIFGQSEWSEVWMFLVGAFIFGILPCLLVTFGAGILTAIQNFIIEFVFGKSVESRDEIIQTVSYVPEEREIPQSGESIPSNELIELKRLFDMGVITEEDFNIKKQKLLDL